MLLPGSKADETRNGYLLCNPAAVAVVIQTSEVSVDLAVAGKGFASAKGGNLRVATFRGRVSPPALAACLLPAHGGEQFSHPGYDLQLAILDGIDTFRVGFNSAGKMSQCIGLVKKFTNILWAPGVSKCLVHDIRKGQGGLAKALWHAKQTLNIQR